jgi:hypothetical protein
MKRIFIWTIAGAALLYGADVAWVAIRGERAYGRMEVSLLLAVPQKGSRVEYIPGGTETRACVYALFPQRGFTPCWYVARHKRQEVDY